MQREKAARSESEEETEEEAADAPAALKPAQRSWLARALLLGQPSPVKNKSSWIRRQDLSRVVLISAFCTQAVLLRNVDSDALLLR